MWKVDVFGEIENLLGFVGGRIDAFSRNRLHVDIASGLAAALSLSLLVVLLDSASDNDKQNFGFILNFILLNVACYLTPVVLLHLTGLRWLKRFVPSCILIAIFGSLLLICSVTGHHVLESFSRSELPLSEALKEKFWDALAGLTFLSVLTLPTTFLVHYSGAIVRAVDRWHNGTGKLPSIVE